MTTVMPVDFVQLPDEGEFFRSFLCAKEISTEIGEFKIELSTDDLIANTPSKPLLLEMQFLIDRFEESVDKILELIFAHYQQYSMEKDWMVQCNVPQNLEKQQLLDFITGQRLSVIRESGDDEEHFHSRVYVSPEWDTEHSLYFKYESKKWTLANC